MSDPSLDRRQIISAYASEQQLRLRDLLLDSVSEAVIVTDDKGDIVFWNRAAERMYGWPRHEVLGRNIVSVTPQEQSREQAGEIMKALLSGREWTGQFAVHRRDGSAFTALVSDAPILDESGELIGIVGISSEISEMTTREQDLQRIEELNNANNRLRSSNDELHQFAYATSHDLKEPLRTIGIYSELMSRRLSAMGVEDEDLARSLEMIQDNVASMQRLIEGLLQYAMAGVDSTPQLVPLQLESAVRSAVFQLDPLIRDAGAEIRIDPGLPVVLGEEQPIIQLFQNLIGNAIKYRGEKAPIVSISAFVEGGTAEVLVQDNGMGIPREHQDRVFGVFKRLHGRDVPGTGIGLALCKRIVERYGGRIWVESEPGEGCAFHFTLPTM